MAFLRTGVALTLFAFTPADLPGQSIDEYQVKAAFLYNFAKFVEWPAQAFTGPDEPISICIFGQNPFGRSLDDAVRGKVVEGRAFVVLKLSDFRQSGACKILFISSSERKSVRALLAQVKTGGILTVGETEGFAAEGGVVDFTLDEGRVRIEINVQAAEQQWLRISSKLLSLARIVKN